jgi:hypothetical protein
MLLVPSRSTPSIRLVVGCLLLMVAVVRMAVRQPLPDKALAVWLDFDP